jgi:DNA-binding NtrC family response regulator
MTTVSHQSRLALVQHGDAEVSDSLGTCLQEIGVAPVTVRHPERLAEWLHTHAHLRIGLFVLDIQRGRAADLALVLPALRLPALQQVPVFLTTTASSRQIAALPSLGPLVRYLELPFDLDDFLALAAACFPAVRVVPDWALEAPAGRVSAYAVAAR